jgi:CheY-like chemotaxis protein
MDTKRILVVDDEYLLRYALTHALRGEGVEVSAVGSAEEALGRIGDEFYDLCFLDCRLPGLDGLYALRCIKGRSPQTRIVFMTGGCLTTEERALVDRLADAFMEKPFECNHARGLADQLLCPDEQPKNP